MRCFIRTPGFTSESEVVPKAGVEPARAQSSLDFESSASANSATSASLKNYKENSPFVNQLRSGNGR